MRGKFGAFKYSPKGTLLNPDEMEFQTNLMIDLVQNANEKDKVEVGKLTNRVASATSPTTNSGLQHDESHKNGDTRKSRSNDNPDTPKAKEVRLESSDDSRSEEEHLDLIDHFEKVSEKNPQKVMNLLMNYNTERSDIIGRLKESMDNKTKMHENQILRLEQEKMDLERTVTELKKNNIELKREADAKRKPICCGCKGIVDSVLYCSTQCHETHTR